MIVDLLCARSETRGENERLDTGHQGIRRAGADSGYKIFKGGDKGRQAAWGLAWPRPRSILVVLLAVVV
jgi:hypothetical protein